MPKCFPKWLFLFMFPQQLNKLPIVSHSLQYLIFYFSSFQYSEYELLSHCDFCFPDYQWGWMSFYIFMSHLCFHSLSEYCLSTSHLLGTIWVSSTSLKCLYLTFGHFSTELLSLFKGVLYKFQKYPLLAICFTNIVCKFVACTLWYFLMKETS